MSKKSNPSKKNKKKRLLVVVTGISGAGRSVAIKALEDNGFYCIDNLPVGMIEAAAEFLEASSFEQYALGMDIRDANFAKGFQNIKEKLGKNLRADVVFLTADEDIISTRYGETRRKHPLLDTGGQLIAAIRREKKLLQPVKENADIVFDTSSWSPHYLSRVIEDRYSVEGIMRNLFVTITSFGFKNGPLRPADSLYDVRFIDNPYFVPELKEKTGLEKSVKDYIFKDPRASKLLHKLVEMHRFLLPNYYKEGKHYFRVGIGCTGGKHRSVCFAEELGQAITEACIDNVVVSVLHRDIGEINPLALR